jgi:ribonuclease VapC
MSTVNLSEVIQTSEQHGVATEGLEYDLEALGIEFHGFDIGMARLAAELWTEGSGLSLGDRACLALARLTRSTAVTSDRRWSRADLRVGVRLIR